MKKLMFAVAAIAAGVALADDLIPSGNIVGYNNIALRYGGTVTGPNFISVGKDKIDLTSFGVGGESYAPGESAADVVIQVLKYNGSTEASYSWIDLTGDFEPGWYDSDSYDPIAEGDVLLPAGQGMWIQGDDGFDLQVQALVLK